MSKTLLCAASAILLSITGSSLAEGVLIKSYPKNGAEIADFDGTVKFWFNGNVGSRAPSIVVVDSQGQRMDNRDSRLVLGERHRLTATTQPLPPGPYAVRYRVVTEDGLIVSGISKFTVTTAPLSAQLTP